MVEDPSVAVWKLDRLPEELGNLWQDQSMGKEARAKILEKLTRMCSKKKAR